MKGIVEIYSGDELIYSDNNMLVDGASELLADIMTVSPSLSGIASASAILDSSNYTVQAISFGKDASAYSQNAHKLDERRNLLRYSTPSAYPGLGNVYTAGVLSSAPEVPGPPAYRDVPSSVAHTFVMIDDNTGNNDALNLTIYSLPTSTSYPDTTFSGFQDQWVCYSMYMKPCVPGYPMYKPDDKVHFTTHFKMQIQGSGITEWGANTESGAGLGKSRSSADPRWNFSSCTVSALTSSFNGDNRSSDTSPSGGYSIDMWDQNAGVEDAGDGWYLVWTAALAPVSATSSIQATNYMAGHDGVTPTGEFSGGVYGFGAQLEFGRWPTARQFNNDYQANMWSYSGTVLNRDHSPGAAVDNGTVRVVGDFVNPNLLAYTINPHDNPDMTGNDDITSQYWSRPNDQLGCFSATTATTNPFGGTSSLILSALDEVTTSNIVGLIAHQGKLGWNPDDDSELVKPGIACPGCWREADTSIWSVYVKCASTVGGYTTASSFMLGQGMPGQPDEGGIGQYLHFKWDNDGVPSNFGSLQDPTKDCRVDSVGDDWYRIQHRVQGWGYAGDGSFTTSTVEGYRKQAQLYLSDYTTASPHDDISGTSLFYYAPQLEVYPNYLNMSATQYRQVSAIDPEPSSLTPVSSYTPYNGISSPPNPASTRLEDGNTDNFGPSSTTSGFNMGQNLNVIPYREQGGQAPHFFNLWGVATWAQAGATTQAKGRYIDGGKPQVDLWQAGAGTSYPLSGYGSIGPQAYWMGCYPEGSSTGGSDWAIVSSLENSGAYVGTNNVKGTYNSLVNEASSMDTSGFIGKVYDTINHKVGGIPNPNCLPYTVDPGGSPGVTFPDDLDGIYWQSDQTKTASYSSVEYTNPFGGPSSMLWSGLSSFADTGPVVVAGSGYMLAIASTGNDNIPDWNSTSSQSYIQTIYVKRPTDGYETSSCMMKIKDVEDPEEGYIATWEFLDGGTVPTLKTSHAKVTTGEESVGDGWYRLQNRLDGSDASIDSLDGDTIRSYYYMGDSTADASANLAGKTLYAYAPQLEVYEQVYGFSATPYQAVSAVSPAAGENEGTGGLYVSSLNGFSSTGEVTYEVTIGSGDVGYSNLYGGITNMGLFTIDVNQSLKGGNTAPYSFDSLNNPREYRLLSTKALSRNLGYINDAWPNAGATNYKDLTIRWRLRFV